MIDKVGAEGLVLAVGGIGVDVGGSGVAAREGDGHTLRRPVGSIRRAALSEIWARSPELKQLRALRIRDLVDCPSCELRPHCNRCAGFAVAGADRGGLWMSAMMKRARSGSRSVAST